MMRAGVRNFFRILGAPFKNRLFRRTVMAVALLGFFLTGYGTTSSVISQCRAQIIPMTGPGVIFPGGIVVAGGFCVCCKSCASPCDPSGTASQIRSAMEQAFEGYLEDLARYLEDYMGTLIDNMVEVLLNRIELMEQNLELWFGMMWSEELYPAMRLSMKQMSAMMADQVRTTSTIIDAYEQNQLQLALREEQARDRQNLRPSEDVCVAATMSTGFGRAAGIGGAMRQAYQNDAFDFGLNKRGVPGANAAGAAEEVRYRAYEGIFCDPANSGGQDVCGPGSPGSAAPPPSGDRFANADIRPNDIIFNQLTIPVDDDTADGPGGTIGTKTDIAVRALLANMIGATSADAISRDSLGSSGGQEKWLKRRSFLARHAALKAVPQISVGWRMPGSQLGPFVDDLRQAAGVHEDDIADNPSYREVMHAIAIDRIMGGEYATDMITNQNALELEKLKLDAYYLMLLRDYYELLERTALSLAVEVSMIADQVPLPDTESARLKK